MDASPDSKNNHAKAKAFTGHVAPPPPLKTVELARESYRKWANGGTKNSSKESIHFPGP